MKLIEAVPNVSEGKNAAVLQALAAVLRRSGAKLLGTDSNPDANRTVFTLAGTPQSVTGALFEFIREASSQIDMRRQSGAHPRLGAVDVCPLVPLRNISLEETAALARDLGRRAGEELGLPVYLYEAAAAVPERRNLAFLRKGEYESLPQKLKKLPPDFGPAEFSPSVQKTGACVIGARNFLLAFNVSLNTADVSAAKEIASVLREKNGGLKAVKAIGWYMEDYGCAQVSFNLTDFRQTGLAQVFEACRREAGRRGLRTAGSELIGLLPQEALLNAGRFYAPAQTDKAALMQTAVCRLTLDEIRPFHIRERILEFQLQDPGGFPDNFSKPVETI